MPMLSCRTALLLIAAAIAVAQCGEPRAFGQQEGDVNPDSTPRPSSGAEASSDVSINVKFQTAPVPRGWTVFASKALNARMALPAQPQESNTSAQIPEGLKEATTDTLVVNAGAEWDRTFTVERVFYPESFGTLSDNLFFKRAVEDAMMPGSHRLLAAIKHIAYGTFPGRAIHFETRASNGFVYETVLEIFREGRVAYVHQVSTEKGKLTMAVAGSFLRNIRLLDAEVVSVGGPLFASEPPVDAVPDLRYQSAEVPAGWVSFSPKGFRARVAFPGQAGEETGKDLLPDGILEDCMVSVGRKTEHEAYYVMRYVLPPAALRLDDEAFFARAIGYVVPPGSHHLVEPARRVAYGRIAGRSMRYESDWFGNPIDEQIEIFRYGRLAYVAVVTGPRGKLNPDVTRAFFRNVRLLEIEPEGAGGPLFTSAPAGEPATDLRGESAELPAGWLAYESRAINARMVFPGTPVESVERYSLPEGIKELRLVKLSRGSNYFVGRVHYPDKLADLDDEAMFARVMFDIAFPARHRLVEPARRVAYGLLVGRAARYESVEAHTGVEVASESRIELYRNGLDVYVVALTALKGAMNENEARAFFRSVAWLDAPGGRPQAEATPSRPAAPAVAPPGWQVFSAPKGGFRIGFPSAFESKFLTVQGGRLIQASRFAKNQPYLEASEVLFDKPDEARDSFRSQASRMREPEGNTTVLATREVAPAPGWQGMEAVTKSTSRNDPPQFERKRLYFDGGSRVVELRVNVDDYDPKELAEQFFGSFELIAFGEAPATRAGSGTSQPAAPHWETYRAPKYELMLEFPAKASDFEDGTEGEFKSLAVDADLGPSHYRMFWTESVGDDPEANARSSHEGSLKYIRALGAVVKVDTPIKLGSWSGQSFMKVDDFAEPPTVERQWVLYNGASQTLYVKVTAPKDVFSEENARRFFASLRAPGLVQEAKREDEAKPAAPEASKADARVRKALDQLNQKYSVNSRGAFRLEYRLEGDRTQLVIVESETTRLGALEIREIWSTSQRVAKGNPPAEVLAKLLNDSQHKKLGGWQLVPMGEGSQVIFCAEIPADSSPEVLKTVIEAVTKSADLMEKELTGKDDF